MKTKNNKPCSEEKKDGTQINSCEDFPITFCRKCGTFYVLDSKGNREEISLKELKGYAE